MKTVIHVGLQKTASTMLQRNLHRNRQLLQGAGIGYVRLRPLNETADIAHLPALTATIRALAIPNRQAPDANAVTAELESIRSMGEETIIISDENILGPINHESGKPAYPNAGEIVEWLIDTLGPDSYRVILYVRSQDTYIESTYLHRIHIGRSIRFNKYLKRIDIESFDWDALATRIASRIGRGNMSVVPYETIERGELVFINRFLELGKVPVRFQQEHLADQTSNRSYSALALELALRCNDILEAEDLRSFRYFLQTNYSNATHERPTLLTDERRKAIKSRFEVSNKAVLRKYSSPEDHSDGFV